MFYKISRAKIWYGESMVLRRFNVKGVGQFFAREQMTFFDLWGNIDI